MEVTGIVRRRWKPLAAALRADINLVLAANRVALLNARLARQPRGSLLNARQQRAGQATEREGGMREGGKESERKGE